MKKRELEKKLREINILEIRPIRAAEAEERYGRVVVLRPPPTSRGVRRVVDRVLNAMSASRIRLDEVGSFTWSFLDGSRTVKEIAQELREEFGDAVEPAEERLAQLIRSLRGQELVRYLEWDD